MELKEYWFLDGENPANIPVPKLRFNTLHDLESLWWIGAHFVTARAVTPVDGGELSADDRYWFQQHVDLADEIFYAPRERPNVMISPTFFLVRLGMLHPAVRAVGAKLQESRRALVRAYKKAEKVIHEVDFHCADGVHEMLRDCFISIAQQFEEDDIQMEPIRFAS